MAHRLDFAPLVRLVASEDSAPLADVGEAPKVDTYLSQRFGVGRKTVQRWHSRGIDVWWADKLCTAVGLEPSLVWGDEYVTAIDAECMAKGGCLECDDWLCLCDAATTPQTPLQLALELGCAS